MWTNEHHDPTVSCSSVCSVDAAREKEWTGADAGGLVVIGDTIQLQSNTLKESRTLLIAEPVGYDSGTDRYPVWYRLHGELHFLYTATIGDFLAGNDRIPKML